MVTEKQRKAREKFVKKYAGNKGKKKKGTTKGESRKTARRAYEPKKKTGKKAGCFARLEKLKNAR